MQVAVAWEMGEGAEQLLAIGEHDRALVERSQPSRDVTVDALARW
jgi:hypothetical protein